MYIQAVLNRKSDARAAVRTVEILPPSVRSETLIVDPCIPSSWPEYRMTWRFLDSCYEITVSNPLRKCRGVAGATLDGVCVNASAIPLVNDGRVHEVQVVLGDEPKR